MTQEDLKELARDSDGLATYEYLANHIGLCDDDMPAIVDNMIRVDRSGQFTVSAARYLAAIDLNHFAPHIRRLADAAIEKDRERRYIADLLPAIWGPDFAQQAPHLSLTDNTFRRIFRRANEPR